MQKIIKINSLLLTNNAIELLAVNMDKESKFAKPVIKTIISKVAMYFSTLHLLKKLNPEKKIKKNTQLNFLENKFLSCLKLKLFEKPRIQLLGKYYDRFEGLSNKERHKEFSKLIPEVDQNGDMTITLDELKDWLIGQIEKQASKFSDDSVNMTHIDHNSDGKLSLEEMMEDFKKHQP